MGGLLTQWPGLGKDKRRNTGISGRTEVDTLGLLWDIALARGQSNTNASQCLSHCSLLATSHVVIENMKCGQ